MPRPLEDIIHTINCSDFTSNLRKIVRHGWSEDLGWCDIGRLVSHYGFSPVQSFKEIINEVTARNKFYSTICPDERLIKVVEATMPWGLRRVAGMTPASPITKLEVDDVGSTNEPTISL